MRRTTAVLSAGALALAAAMIAGPASAADGDLSLDKTTVTVGDDASVTATLKGCDGFAFGGIALFAADADIENDDPIVDSEDAELDGDNLVGTLDLSAVEAGDYLVAAVCAEDDSDEADGNFDAAALKVVAPEVTPEPEPAQPAPPAKPVVKQPTFTG